VRQNIQKPFPTEKFILIVFANFNIQAVTQRFSFAEIWLATYIRDYADANRGSGLEGFFYDVLASG